MNFIRQWLAREHEQVGFMEPIFLGDTQSMPAFPAVAEPFVTTVVDLPNDERGREWPKRCDRMLWSHLDSPHLPVINVAPVIGGQDENLPPVYLFFTLAAALTLAPCTFLSDPGSFSSILAHNPIMN